jgi:hypothetical protein
MSKRYKTRKVPVYCIKCDVELGEKEVGSSFIGNAIFTLCERCRGD